MSHKTERGEAGGEGNPGTPSPESPGGQKRGRHPRAGTRPDRANLDARIDLAISFLRRGIDRPREMVKEAIRLGLIPKDLDSEMARDRMRAAIEAAKAEAYQRIGPESIDDARGALARFSAQMLELFEIATSKGDTSEARESAKACLKAHGVRLDEDVESVEILLRGQRVREEIPLEDKLLRMFRSIPPHHADILLTASAAMDQIPLDRRPETDLGGMGCSGESTPAASQSLSDPEREPPATTGEPSTDDPPTDSTAEE
jgi:hypothetical protein